MEHAAQASIELPHRHSPIHPSRNVGGHVGTLCASINAFINAFITCFYLAWGSGKHHVTA